MTNPMHAPRLMAMAVMTAASINLFAQSYTSWLTGNPNDVEVQPEFGICLMGGAGESDEAMQWFLQKANGGDVLVIRASGADGYNNYLYSGLGITVNSVETIRFDNAAAATDPYVLDKLSKAEAIWIAGGNQANYVNYWKNTPVEDAINHLINVKGGPVGGISAGMAIMGQSYFPALAGGITSATALANPFHGGMQFGYDDFIDAPFMKNVITDTHFNDPQALRYGRIMAFMSRMYHDHGVRPFGMGANEFCAIAIEEDGLARAFGEFGSQWPDDYVYFLQANCIDPIGPEIIQSATPLTWNRNQEAVKVYRVPATTSGLNYFDLNTWNDGEGGQWMNWYVDAGTLTMSEGATAPVCVLSVRNQEQSGAIRLFPNPSRDLVTIQHEYAPFSYTVFDLTGRLIMQGQSVRENLPLDISGLSPGFYKVSIRSEKGIFSTSFVRGN